MKKLICILASAALLGACEQKTETVAPAGSPAGGKTENNTTVVNPSPATSTKSTDTTTTNINTASSPGTSTSTTTTTSSPSP